MNVCVVGNGNIVKRFLEDVQELKDVQITALCVREKSRAAGEALVEKYRIPRLSTDYPALLKESFFDTVYIGIANHMHYSYAREALLAGKHVICEKPFTVKLEEAEELADLAMKQGLFLWEACKIPYSRTYQVLRDNLPLIGTPRVMHCNYSRKSSRYEDFKNGNMHAAFDPKKAGGALYDINVYNLHLISALFGSPRSIHYYANQGPNGVDISGTAVMEYEGFQAVCTGSKDSSSPCGVILQGEDGYLRLEGPASSASRIWLCQGGEEQLLLEQTNSGRLTWEIREFARQFHEKDMDACRRALEHSLLVMRLLNQSLVKE